MANVISPKSPKPVRTSSADSALSRKYHAAGKVPGGFFKRECPTEKETLTARLIDGQSAHCLFQASKTGLVTGTVLKPRSGQHPDMVAMDTHLQRSQSLEVPFMWPNRGLPRRLRRR